MSQLISKWRYSGILCVVMMLFFSANSFAEIDADAAMSLARQNDCFKCHAVDKTKIGPSFKQVAINLKADPDGESKLIKHLTTGPVIKLQGGMEMNHKMVDSQDQAEIKNLSDWILSL